MNINISEKICINCWEYLNLPNAQKELAPVIFAWYRDSQRNRKRLVFRGFEPYFYVAQNCMVPQFYFHKDTGEKERLVKRLEHQARSPDNPMLTKVVTFLPSQVRVIRSLLESSHYEDDIFEADIEFIYRFMIDKKIKCALERTSSGFLPIDEDVPSNLKYVFMDLEVFTNRKPDPRKLRVGEKVICATLWDNYSKIYHLFYEYSKQLTLPDYGPDVVIHYCVNERELLKSVAKYLIEQDPDIISGYNIDWDLTCLIKTMEQRYKMSPDVISPLKKVKIQNSKKRLGDVLINAPRAKIFGRSVLDLLELYLKMHLSGLEEMTLEYVAQQEKLPVQKIVVPDFFNTWNKNPELIIRRNLSDVKIYVELEKKLSLIRFADEQRKLVGCRLEDTLSSKKMLDLFMMRMKGNKIMPTARSRGEKYIGAYVRDPLPGMYGWVIQLDFSALYPHIMMCFNIDPDTFRNPQLYKGSEDLFRLDDSHAFVKSPTGLIPKMLKELLELRAKKKQLQKEALSRNDDEAYKMYNLQEGVIKVLSNALYGVMGYRFRKGSKETVESVTLMGRNLITFVADKLIESGRKVLYGDSVLPDSPIIVLKDRKEIDIKPISEAMPGEFVWSDEGFTKIIKVIRKPKRKEIYRINTRKGLVEVTEDHSLLDENKNVCKPAEIEKESKLLQRNLPCSNTIHLDKNLAWLFGLFAAEGTAKDYSYKGVWKIDMQNVQVLEKAGRILKDKTHMDYSIFKIPSSGKGMYRLIAKGAYGEVRKIARKWHALFYDSFEKKKVPFCVLNSRLESKIEFLRGYNLGDGYQDERYHFEFQDFQTNSKTLALGLVFILEALGRDYNLESRKDKLEIIRIRINSPERKKGNSKRKKVSNAIKEIYRIHSDFKEVIDLETRNHHFHSGIGEIIVHNTDSVFFEAKGQNLDECLEEAKQIQALVHSKLPEFLTKFGKTDEQPFNIDPAQIYSSFFILEAKKRYAGKIEWDSKRGTKLSYRFNIKGLETRRSDLSVFGKRIQKEIIHMLLEKASKEEILKFLEENLNKFDTLPLTEIGIPSAIGQPLKAYKGNAIQKTSAEYSNKFLNTHFDVGSKPKRIAIKSVPHGYEATHSLDIDYGVTLPPGFEVDYVKILDSTVKKKIEKLIAIRGITWDEINLKPELRIIPKIKKPKKEKNIKDDKQKTLTQFKC